MPIDPLLYPFPKSKIAHFFEEILLHSWWIILFVLLCYMVYEKGQVEIKKTKSTLQQQLGTLQISKMEAAETQKRLRMQLDSQNDPDWIALTLIKELGLVPKGQKKVFFIRRPSNP